MAKKGENIRKRKDGRWEGRITVTCDNGGKKVYSLYDHSYQKVKEKLYDARKKLSVSTAILNGKGKGVLKSAGLRDMTWDLLAKEWLENIRKTKKHSTFIKYRNIYQNYIKEFFVTYSLAQTIDSSVMEEVFEKITDLSDSTAQSIRSVLKSIFTYAKEKYKLAVPVATCQGRIYHFPSFFPVLPCFPCSKSWRMTRLSLSATLWVLLSLKCTSMR